MTEEKTTQPDVKEDLKQDETAQQKVETQQEKVEIKLSDTPIEKQEVKSDVKLEASPKPQPPSDGKVILRFKGINIPGGKGLGKGYKMSKDKTVDHIIVFITKQLRDTTTTYRVYFNNCLLSPDDSISDILREFQITKSELELTFSPIDNVFG
ncbi:hypothetical protein EIN_053950 [Entamoeba invadens IP1]|uniref:hypothetical protein n=1 Tax=Entamoeba invadens IP1 TaxID=370355 RepID=UPI0002C3E56D|nr:hypothetical protein EIN_053950 [Entamoeba invadens IP1]ELP93130.1 hypothetical protein EIN_053950 [Entamoeba invadens IP1]|eukprot:XP_004259901.1 hypothetical protein EIN_053950 [Entamoeba invadens IP1]